MRPERLRAATEDELMNAPGPMLPLTQVIPEPSHPNSSSFAWLAPPWPVGLLDRPIDTATEFAAGGPDRPTARPKRSTRRKKSPAAVRLPLTRIARSLSSGSASGGPNGSAGTTGQSVTPPLAAPSPRSSARAAHRRRGRSIGPGCSRNPSRAAASPLLHPAPIRRPS